MNTVGAAFTIIDNGDIARMETLGKRNADRNEAVDEHTIFRLASVSKGFAGVLAAILDHDRHFSLEDPVIKHYPDLGLKDSVNTVGLTVKHLLSHATGMVPHAFDNLVEAGIPLKDIVARFDEVDISAPPGELYGYQNVAFSLIDPIVESLTNMTYPELLNKEIFGPLMMYDASAGMQWLDPTAPTSGLSKYRTALTSHASDTLQSASRKARILPLAAAAPRFRKVAILTLGATNTMRSSFDA